MWEQEICISVSKHNLYKITNMTVVEYISETKTAQVRKILLALYHIIIGENYKYIHVTKKFINECDTTNKCLFNFGF